MNKEWSNDWITFATQLVELSDGGSSEAEISAQFREQEVQWQGTIKLLKLDNEFVPGMTLSMSEEPLPMTNGRELWTNHVVLSIPECDQETWRDSKIGDLVTFTATIAPNHDLAPEIEFDEFEGDPMVNLMLTLHNCTKLNPA